MTPARTAVPVTTLHPRHVEIDSRSHRRGPNGHLGAKAVTFVPGECGRLLKVGSR
jgi:hypothetical protein